MTALAQQHPYDALSETYDRAHERWLRFAGGEAQCAFEGAATALLRPGMNVLDVACGTGTVVRRLLREAEGAFDLVLLDASANMLDKCRDIAARRVLGCMKNLPFGAGHFDLVTCAWGIETLRDPQAALSEFIRVTQPGGHVCLVFCADRHPQSVVGSALRRRITRSGRGRFINPDTLQDQARQAGARTVRMLHCTGPAAAMILHI